MAAALREALEEGRFGAAGSRVVVEERLVGPEASVMALCDETAVLALPAARDHKRLGDARRRPQHRRHGRLLAAAGPGRGGRRSHPGDHPRPRPGGSGPSRDPLPRRALRRPDAHRRRPSPARIQRAPGRPGGAGRPAAAGRAARAAPGGRRGGPPGRRRRPGSAWRRRPSCRRLPRPVWRSCWRRRATPSDRAAAIRSPAWPMRAAPAASSSRRASNGRPRASSTAGGRVLTVVGRGRDLAAAADAAYEAAGHVTFAGAHLRRDIGRVAAGVGR